MLRELPRSRYQEIYDCSAVISTTRFVCTHSCGCQPKDCVQGLSCAHSFKNWSSSSSAVWQRRPCPDVHRQQNYPRSCGLSKYPHPAHMSRPVFSRCCDLKYSAEKTVHLPFASLGLNFEGWTRLGPGGRDAQPLSWLPRQPKGRQGQPYSRYLHIVRQRPPHGSGIVSTSAFGHLPDPTHRLRFGRSLATMVHCLRIALGAAVRSSVRPLLSPFPMSHSCSSYKSCLNLIT